MSNTYQYQPPNGTKGPVTPINGDTLQAGSGTWFIHSNGVHVTATENNEISFLPRSNFNTTDQPDGGQVDTYGSFNLATASSGGFFVNDSHSGDAFNTYIVGKDVPQLTAVLQPTDKVLLQDVTPSDLKAAFANANPHGDGYHEVLTVNRAGASPLTIEIPDHHGLAAMPSQFHGS